jgi:cytochrome c nitrite reductase small subunit
MEPGSRPFIVLGTALGLLIGVGLYTYVYARGASYLTDDPAACANCHVMSEQYSGWMKGSHRSVAVCNDCHTPHGFVGKYSTKALNGFWHSFAFTTGRFPDNIRINDRNHRVTESACRTCHEGIVHAIDPGAAAGRDLGCIRCHEAVGHGP